MNLCRSLNQRGVVVIVYAGEPKEKEHGDDSHVSRHAFKITYFQAFGIVKCSAAGYRTQELLLGIISGIVFKISQYQMVGRSNGTVGPDIPLWAIADVGDGTVVYKITQYLVGAILNHAFFGDVADHLFVFVKYLLRVGGTERQGEYAENE